MRDIAIGWMNEVVDSKVIAKNIASKCGGSDITIHAPLTGFMPLVNDAAYDITFKKKDGHLYRLDVIKYAVPEPGHILHGEKGGTLISLFADEGGDLIVKALMENFGGNYCPSDTPGNYIFTKIILSAHDKLALEQERMDNL